MKKQFLITAILLLTGLIVTAIAGVGLGEEEVTVLDMQKKIGEGKNRQVEVLFEGPRRKIVQITLRNHAILESHKVPEPITIQCIAGKGTMYVGEGRTSVELERGTLVTIEPDIVHEIQAQPAVSVLLSKFHEK